MFQQYAPRGSDLYYVLRQVPSEVRPAYLALSAFCFELNRTAEHYTEATVAEKKLVWMAEEIERFSVGKETHPLLRPLAGFRERLSKTALLALVEANLLSIQTHIFETRSEVLQHYQHLGGIRFALLSKLFQDVPVDTETHLHDLGIVDELLRHLRDFRIFLGRQHLYFALEDFQHCKIDPQLILQLKQPELLQPLFDEYFHFAKDRFQNLKAYFEATPIRPLQLEVLLKLKQAAAAQRDAWQFFRYQVELSPLRKLWLSSF